ncbi:hypothetical protein D3C86_1605950 [compost metagenome]
MVTPGTSAAAALIFSESSSNDFAEVHSDLFLRLMIISPISMGRGSVGTSLLPILVTIFLTSGKRAFRIPATFWTFSMVVLRLLPERTRVSTA